MFIKYILEKTQCFLSLFNFSIDIDEDLYNSLVDIDNIIIKDENKNPVGYLQIDESGKVFIQALFDDYYFSSVGVASDRFRSYSFDFDITNATQDEKLNGKFIMKKGSSKKAPVFMANILVFKDGKFHLKYDFNTINNTFCVVNSENSEKIKYNNNFTAYYRNNKKFQITYNNGCILYNDILYPRGVNDIYGGYYLYFPYSRENNFNAVEYEFNNVINEIVPEYFEFMEKQKILLNKYHDNLFENLVWLIFNNLNKSKIELIFDIHEDDKVKKLSK